LTGLVKTGFPTRFQVWPPSLVRSSPCFSVPANNVASRVKSGEMARLRMALKPPGRSTSRQARPPLVLRKIPLGVPAKIVSSVSNPGEMTRLRMCRSSKPKFQVTQCRPRSVERSTPSSSVPAKSMPSWTKLGEMTNAETTGGGEGSWVLSQFCPLSDERNIPPLQPTKTLGSSSGFGGIVTASVGSVSWRFKEAKAGCQVRPLLVERYRPEARAAKQTVFPPFPNSLGAAN